LKRGTLDWEIIASGNWQAKAKGYEFNVRPDSGFTGSGYAWCLDLKPEGSKKVRHFNLIRSRMQAPHNAELIVEQHAGIR
jgi:hypothetical protein